MNLIQSREIDVEVGDDEEKMVQGQKNPSGEMFQVKSDYPACFPLTLTGGQVGVGCRDRADGWIKRRSGKGV